MKKIFENTTIVLYRKGKFVCKCFDSFSSLSAIFYKVRKNNCDSVIISNEDFYGEYKVYNNSVKKIY